MALSGGQLVLKTRLGIKSEGFDSFILRSCSGSSVWSSSVLLSRVTWVRIPPGTPSTLELRPDMVGRANTPEGEDKRRKAISEGGKRNVKARQEASKGGEKKVRQRSERLERYLAVAEWIQAVAF